jgi:hypothetical protein
MKHYSKIVKPRTIGQVAIIFAVLATQSACTSGPLSSSSSGKEIAAAGPSVLNVRAEPTTVELNQSLIPFGQAKVIADVKDFTAPVTEVTLKFKNVPLAIPMQNTGGTTWVATLGQHDLQNLAVRGKTINYDAEIYAKDQKNQAVLTNSAVTVGIKAPEASTTATG